MLTYVPNNNDPGKNERTPKLIEPTILTKDRRIEFVYPLDQNDPDARQHSQTVIEIARHIRCLGWGIDLAIGHATVGEPTPRSKDRRVYGSSPPFTGGDVTFAPKPGTLQSLEAANEEKLARFRTSGLLFLENQQPVCADVVYRSTTTIRHFAAFRFLDENDDPVAYRTNEIKEIAGHLRHLARRACEGKIAPDLIAGMIMGHPKDSPRLSVLPIPSIGHAHSDGRIRRVIFAEPFGSDGTLCTRLRTLLDQQTLQFEGDCPCPSSRLMTLPRKDSVINRFADISKKWASVTPVLLPGHNERRQDDASKSLARATALVNKSLQQAGITQPATFEINRVPYWRGTRHVRDYHPREKLQHCPRFHVQITFDEFFTGPLAIGAGRHVGFGTFAAMDGSSYKE